MVGIKDMEMPENCLDCPISHEDKIDYYICGKTGKNVYLYANEIHPDCPLIEIVTCKDCVSRDTRTEKDGFAYCSKKGMDTHKEYFCPKGERKDKKI